MAAGFTIKRVTDNNEIYAIARNMGDLVKVKKVDVDESTTPGHVANYLSEQAAFNPRFSFFAAYNEIGAALGYITGEIRPSFYVENQLNGYELLWVVGDMFRKSGVGLALLKAWEDHCKQNGCKHVYMGLSAHTNPEILRKIYAARGYTLHSESFSKTF